MRKKILALGLGIIFCLSLIVIVSTHRAHAEDKKSDVKETKDDLYSKVELFSYALTTIQSEYVDEKGPKDLIYGSLKGLLSSLDPHSQFLDPDEYKDLKSETEGRFGGLGVEITFKEGLLTVISPIEDTPAWKAGIKAGDRIVKIEKELTRDMSLDEAVKHLRGKPGTVIHLTILRESEGQVKEYTITRELIRVQDVKEAHLIDNHIAYIRLTEFRENSYKEFHGSIEKLRTQGADSIIVDLRNNPGGLLSTAIRISEDFLPSGKTIVSTKGRHLTSDTLAKSNNGHGDFLTWPMVILINEGSASASEIVAGAMKDNKRAVIVGVKSFGKGSVQSVIPLPDGSGLRLTTAKYFTPSGICIHGIGIAPDVLVEKIKIKESLDADKEKEKDKEKKDVDQIFDEIKNKDAVQTEQQNIQSKKDLEQKKKDQNDNQLQAAVDIIKGIKVYKSFSETK